MRNMKKAQRILKNEEMAVIITEDAAWLNGDAIEVLIGIQKVLQGIVDDGFPRDLAKDLINVAFMTSEEKTKKISTELNKLGKNLEKLDKKLKESKNEHK